MTEYNCSTWLKQQIDDLSTSPKLWIRDRDHLLEPSEIEALEKSGKADGKQVFVIKHSLELRLRLIEQGIDPPPRWIVVDQSIPVDSKNTKSREVFAPDLKHELPSDKIRFFTIRDYLVAQTRKDSSWPEEVNEFPYRELARYYPSEFLEAYQDFRQGISRGFSALDLKLIAAGAVLDTNFFKLSPIELLRLSSQQSHDQWQRLSEFFNDEEIKTVKEYLRKEPSPLGDLFNTTPGINRLARLATLSLMLLSLFSRQFPGEFNLSESPGSYLSSLSPSLAQYSNAAPIHIPKHYPLWLEEEFRTNFDKTDCLSSLISLLGFEKTQDTTKTRMVLELNPPSPGLRERADIKLSLSGEFLKSPTRETPQIYQGNNLGLLIPRFAQAKRDIRAVSEKAADLARRLGTIPFASQTIDMFVTGFCQDDIYRLEILIDRLKRCIRGIDSQSGQRDHNFKEMWANEKREAANLQEQADKALKDLDYRLARLLQERYKEVIPGKIRQTWQVYEQFIAPKRQSADGKLRPAAIIIFDGMRYDTWRELIRPRLEKRYYIDHEELAMATLPSETIVSRRASFAGAEPARINSRNELELFDQLLQRIHHSDPKLVTTDDKDIFPGVAFSFTSKDKLTRGIIFDFHDKSGHAFTWGQELLMQTWGPILDESVDNWLERLPAEVDIFIYSDHGQVLSGPRQINLPSEACLDVGYRCARLKRRIDGPEARHFVQISSGDLGHPPGTYFAFPLPDYSFALLDARFRPTERYRHSGISMYELFVPFAHLRSRQRERRFTLQLHPVDTYQVGQPQPGKILAELKADSPVVEPIELISLTDGITPLKVQNISSDRQLINLKFHPAQAGNVEIEVSAFLGAEHIASAKLSVYVEPGPTTEAPPDRILRMFGD